MLLRPLQVFPGRFFVVLASATLLAAPVWATGDRITAPVDVNRTTVLPGRIPLGAQARYDQGPVDPAMPLDRITVLLRPDPSLDVFLQELHTPGAANYRNFLTPEQFGERFGASANDLAAIRGWLESQGLKVTETARGRHWLVASGSAAAAGRAFHTSFRRYLVNGERHFANSVQPSVPAALSGVVAGLYGLHDFLPMPMLQQAMGGAAPQANSGSSHFISPDDFATIFDVHALYAAGIDGTGQSIAVAGQTNLNLSDIANFRSQFNLPPSAPQMVLVGKDPGNLGGSQLAEADLDIEWSGAVAPGAKIIFVYSGDAFTSAQYAVDQNLAPVLTISFGSCEQDTTIGLRYVFQQANAQGITAMAASGDDGTAICDAIFGTSTQQGFLGPSAAFPAGVPEVTAVGGTTLAEGDGVYWAPLNNANGGSALSYIPETTWNDTIVRNSFAASGGGASVVFPQPSWQSGPGVPNGGARVIPDISLPASPQHDGYQVVTAGGTSIFGGTSVSSPAFAGIVALLNQYLVTNGSLAQPGLGNINPDLYRLAQATGAIFHDVATGNNKVACAQASPACSAGLVGYDASPGYDAATGWGSVDANNLVTQWNTGSATTTSLSASPASAALGDNVQLTATVTGGGSAVPGGTVTFLAADSVLGSAALSSGTATLTVTGLQLAGARGKVTAAYGGDAIYDGSGATITVSINPPAKGSQIVPAVAPNPVPGIANSGGTIWTFTVTLTNLTATATTLTGFQISGLGDETALITRFFGTSRIAASGSVSANLLLNGISAPATLTFTFSGLDADGSPWTQSLPVAFAGIAGPPLFAAISLQASPDTAVQDPGNAACPWAEPLTVQNLSGFPIVLNAFSAGASSLTSSISQIFGTNRLAPYGTLQGTYCASASTTPSTMTFSVGGSSNGGAVSGSRTVAFVAASNPQAFSASPASIAMPVTADAPSGTASLALAFADSQAAWSISVLPVNGGTAWLSVNPLSGAGSAQVNVSAVGSGLSNGVYQALLLIRSAAASPPYLIVPVALVVGASSSATIDSAVNNASNEPAFAPGAQIAVYGSQLAPAGISVQTRQLPLPLTVSGVSAAVNGVAAPLYYVSANQLDIQIPYETTAGPAVLSVNNNGEIAAFPLTIAPTAPGIFGLSTTSGSPATSAAPGSTLVAYITGAGDVTPSLATGATPPSSTPVNALPHPRQAVSVTVGGVTATALFVGIPAGTVGITQINFTVPASVPAGSQPVVVTVGGIASPPVNVTVTSSSAQ